MKKPFAFYILPLQLQRIFPHVYPFVPRPPQLASVDLVYFKLSRLAQTQVLAATGLNRGMADWSPAQWLGRYSNVMNTINTSQAHLT